ncbi:MAG TPA: hypothetical protein VMH04_11695 [Candidatus Solibacter sp.]|nr:hypothetical protein [Candidatus Solibacter sp.]
MKRIALIMLFAFTVVGLYAFPPATKTPPAPPLNVLTWRNDNGATGQNLKETILTPANVNATSFGKIFSYAVDGNIYAQPLYAQSVAIPNKGTHNVVYIATENDTVYAFDADSATLNPSPLWQTALTNPPNVVAYPCLDNHKACTIYPVIGITGTPVINRATQTMYLVARTKEVVEGQSAPFYFERLHALNIRTGAEMPGSPVTICGDYAHTGQGCQFTTGIFDPLADGQRPGILREATPGFPQGVLYIAFAGQGMVLAYDPTTLARLADWTATPTPTNTTGGGGIWTGLTGDANGNVFVPVGDGTFDVNVGGNNYGDSVVKLNLVSDGSGYTLQVMDYFTPPDEACRQTTDIDLGSGSPVLLPTQPGANPNLLVIAGKGSATCDTANPIYLVNASNMGGLGGGVQTIAGTAAKGYYSSAGYFNTGVKTNIYLGGVLSSTAGDNLKNYQMANGLFSPTQSVAKTVGTYNAGATPAISANGTRQGILWTIERPEVLWNETGVDLAVLHAYPATNIHSELYNSNMNATRDQAGPATKFQVPTVVNGKVYVGTQTELDVYGLCPCPQ